LIIRRYFGEEKEKKRINPRISPNGYSPTYISLDKKTHQIHCITGNIAFNLLDERRTGLYLLTNILGGPGMNSRLNMSLRERNGYSYQVESHYTPYTDTGVFLVYFGCEKGKFDKSLDLVYKEFCNIRINKMGSLQLSKAKRQLIGQIAISSESNEYLMLSIGKSLLALNQVDSLEEITKQIESVTATQIMEIANEVLQENKLSVIKYF
jgi:predicted Zn-dependent peptidase